MDKLVGLQGRKLPNTFGCSVKCHQQQFLKLQCLASCVLEAAHASLHCSSLVAAYVMGEDADAGKEGVWRRDTWTRRKTETENEELIDTGRNRD